MPKRKKNILKENPPEEENIKAINKTKWWVYLIEYGVTFSIATGLVFLTLWLRNAFQGNIDQTTMYRYLADAFTIPGMLFILLSILVLIANKGAFAGIGYGLRHLARMLLPFLIRKDITYAEYLQKIESRKSTSIILCFLFVGLAFFSVAIVFIILFFN